MKTTRHLATSCAAVLALVFGTLFVSGAAHAQSVSQSANAGPYSVTLKVLPAETFAGSGSAMVRDGGAMSNDVHGSMHPNHHIVVFVKKNGAPVENAHVAISWRLNSMGAWHKVSVVRMYVRGKGPQTTHYGNNEHLPPGHYAVRVTVNNSQPALFHFSLTH